MINVLGSVPSFCYPCLFILGPMGICGQSRSSFHLMNQLHFPRSRSILKHVIKEQRLLWKLICWFWVVEWIKVMKVRSCQKSFLLKVRREQKSWMIFFSFFLKYLPSSSSLLSNSHLGKKESLRPQGSGRIWVAEFLRQAVPLGSKICPWEQQRGRQFSAPFEESTSWVWQ